MAPVVKELGKHTDRITSRVCLTAQHRQMLDSVLNLFGIVPDYDLNVMEDNQTPTHVVAAVMAKLEPILQTDRPDWVLVQGDTTTVMAASLTAFLARVQVGHVEAGLRTFDKYQPFPEEINRRVAGMVADLHFAPTLRARENLLREGVPDKAICVSGNPVIDSLHMIADLPYDPVTGPLKGLPWDNRLILVTAHRRENFGEPLRQICLALQDVARIYAGKVHIVYPVHPNPYVQETAHSILDNASGVTLIEPLDYHPFVYLMKRSTLVLTDSGGIQEEAPGLGKPVLVLREVTERPEAVEAGTARIVGPNRLRIVEWTRRLLDDACEYDKMAHTVNPFGDGHAANKIVAELLKNSSFPI